MRKAAPLGWFLMVLICSGVLIASTGAAFFLLIPDARDLGGCLKTKMYGVSLCKDDPNYTRFSSISPVARNAVIVSEDAAFWDHKGLDWVELRRSFETNIEKGRLVRGGSTITQQLAKNVYLTPEKTVLRKIREAVIALRIERLYKKEVILEKYLNVVEFDKNVYGIKAASRHYFGVAPSDLTTAQAAWLAFLLPNPKKYAISFHSKKMTPFAFRQMSEIINRLARFKRIDAETRNLALKDARNLFGAAADNLDENYDEALAAELAEDSGEEIVSEAAPDSASSGRASADEPVESSSDAKLNDDAGQGDESDAPEALETEN